MRPRHLALSILFVLCVALAALTARAAPAIGGDLDPTYAPLLGTTSSYDLPVVRAVIALPDGKALIGGDFVSVNGAWRPGVARLNADGSLDATFASQLRSLKVSSLALQPDGKVIVGETGTGALLRLNEDGSLDGGFAGGLGLAATPAALAVLPDGKILAAGAYEVTPYSKNYAGFVARLDAAGQLDPTFPLVAGIGGTVWDLAPLPDGRLVIAGTFFSVGGQPRTHIARLNPDGTLDTSFSPSLNGLISTVAVDPGGALLVGGSFHQVNGASQPFLARLTADGGLAPDQPPSVDAGVRDIIWTPDGGALLGGDFTSVEGRQHLGLFRLLPDGSVDAGFNDAGEASSGLDTLALQPDGAVLTAGAFSFDSVTRTARPLKRFYGAANPGALSIGVAAARVDEAAGALTLTLSRVGGSDRGVAAALRVAGGSAAPGADYHIPPLAGDVLGDGPRSVRQVLVQPDGRLIVAGDFTMAGGRYAGRIARLHVDGSLDPSFDAGLGADALIESATLQPDGKVLIGGDFLRVAGRPQAFLARLNADGSLDAGFTPVLNDRVWEIALQPDGKIFIGGIFGSARVTPLLMRLNADGAPDPSFSAGLEDYGHITALALQPDGKVLIGGLFRHPAVVGNARLLRLNADGSLDATFSLAQSPNGTLREILVLPDGKIVIVGNFMSLGSVPRRYVARLNHDGAIDTGFDPRAAAIKPLTDALPLPDGGLLVGGETTLVAGQAQGSLARLGADGLLDTTYISATDGIIWDLAEGPGGTALVAGDFTRIGGGARPNLVRLGAGGALDAGFDAGIAEGPVVVWEAGDSADKALTITIADDTLVEGDETIGLELLPMGGAAAGVAAITLTIVDDDAPEPTTETPAPTTVTPAPTTETPAPRTVTPAPRTRTPTRLFLPATAG